MTVAVLAAAFCIVATVVQVATVVLTAIRCRRARAEKPCVLPPVSVVRPACGLENFSEMTLGSAFRLDYPDYEVIFCLARADDPVAALIRRLIAANPEVPATLLTGEENAGKNLKLNNFVKGWDAARHGWIISADSNVLMPPDSIRRLMARWRPDSGLVCSAPIATRPQNFAAELECAFLNTYQARWMYLCETLGHGFAQGKTMLLKRAVIEAGGGIRALGRVIAEDAAATMLVRRAGLHVHMVDRAFEQPLGRRSALEVWRRQLRWARMRRVTFLPVYLPELLAGCVFPVAAAICAAASLGWNVAAVVGGLLAVWLGAEVALARVAGWPLSPTTPLAVLVRDLLLPVLWIASWLGNQYVWRGTRVIQQGTLTGEGSVS